jgi:uncharacterized protein (TIGR02996 family)
MDPSHAPFLAAIVADVNSDVPRLQYADFLDETGEPAHAARAEFIRVQCALEGMSKNDPRHDELRSREKALLRGHWREWFEPIRELLREPRFVGWQGWLFRRKREWFKLDGSDSGHWIVRNLSNRADENAAFVGRFQRGFFDSMVLGINPERDSLSFYERLLDATTLSDVDFRGNQDEFEELMLANRRGQLRRLRFDAWTEAMIDTLVGSAGAPELRSISLTYYDTTEADVIPHPLQRLWRSSTLSNVDRFSCFLYGSGGGLGGLIGSPFLRQLRMLGVRQAPRATRQFLADLMRPGVAPNLRELHVTVEDAAALDVDLVHALRCRFGDSLEIRIAPRIWID